MIPPALFFLNIALAVWDFLMFHTNCGIICFFLLWKMSWVFVFVFKERESKEGLEEKPTPLWAGKPTWRLIPWSWDHDMSWRQTSDQLSCLGTPHLCFDRICTEPISCFEKYGYFNDTISSKRDFLILKAVLADSVWRDQQVSVWWSHAGWSVLCWAESEQPLAEQSCLSSLQGWIVRTQTSLLLLLLWGIRRCADEDSMLGSQRISRTTGDLSLSLLQLYDFSAL